jgi:hypothetical protein
VGGIESATPVEKLEVVRRGPERIRRRAAHERDNLQRDDDEEIPGQEDRQSVADSGVKRN